MKILTFLYLSLILFFSCKHEPVISEIPSQSNVNPNNPSTGDSICFNTQIFPLIQSSCAMSGCHDAGTAADGIAFTNYQSIRNQVSPRNLSNSEIYEVITETDLDKRMPPPPSNALSSEQIAIIRSWILEGAKNVICVNSCDTNQFTYNVGIKPIIDTYCKGCHSGANPSGAVLLSNYTEVKMQVDNGKLLGSIKHNLGFSAMPKNSNKLSDCNIKKIEKWIAQGALNN
jgi:mono/diheme cytochrome c family protein